jgi:bifunctional isochorismate lyase/aryl carrier protein
MLRRVAQVHTLHRQTFIPDQAALLVLDMQTYFLSPDSHAFIPSAPAILPNLIALAEQFVRLGYPLIFTRHLNTSEDAGMMGTWWRHILEPANALSSLHPSLSAFPGTVLEKNRYDAFYQTSLESWLRQQHVRQLVMGGVMTHLCCETTARSAFQRDFQVFFLVDGCATYNSAFHMATLVNLNHGFASLVLTEEILAQMETNHAGM